MKRREQFPEKRIPRIPDAEREVMQVLWRNECPITTGQITELLNEKRPWTLSAVQTLLTRLAGKGFVSSEKIGRSRWYTPLVSEREYLRCEGKTFFQRVGESSLTGFVATLYDNESITDSDLDELQRFIDEKKKQK